MRSSLLLSFAVIFLFGLSSVVAWGPVSHYKFATDFISQSAPQQWIGQIDIQALLTAADLPDGMWNGWFLSGTACVPTANHLHSPILAAYLIQAANQTQWSDAQRSFAVGYATHVVSDQVGFASQGGYLGNLSSIINWSTEWPFMLAVDAFIMQNGAYPSDVYPTQAVSEENMEFLTSVVAEYHSAQPSFPLLNLTQLLACSNPWAPQVTQMNAISRTQIPASTTQQLLFFDRFNAQNIGEVSNNLQASWNCVSQTLTYFFQCVVGSEEAGGAMTPELAWKATSQFIDNAYAAGECTAQKM